jgi:hypothetical protein
LDFVGSGKSLVGVSMIGISGSEYWPCADDDLEDLSMPLSVIARAGIEALMVEAGFFAAAVSSREVGTRFGGGRNSDAR